MPLSLSRPGAAESPPPPGRDRCLTPVIVADDTDDESAAAAAAASPELDHLRESLLRMKLEMDAKLRPEPAPGDSMAARVRVLNGLNVLTSPRRAARSQSVSRADRARCHVAGRGRQPESAGGAAPSGELSGRRTSSAPAAPGELPPSVAGRPDLVALGPESPSEDVDDLLVVFDHEDPAPERVSA